MVLSACQVEVSSPTITNSPEPIIPIPTETPLVPGTIPYQENNPPSTPIVLVTPGPMRFFLPTPGEQPILAWRSPIYPVPRSSSPFDHFYFSHPITVDQTNWVNPEYRYGGTSFEPGEVHSGIDISADKRTSVFASGSGQVVWAGWGLYTHDETNLDDPYGMAVVIQHEFGYQNHSLFSVYAHLSRVEVVPGQWLQAGDKLGEVGETGLTSGPHLHFEVRVGEDTYFNTSNPELWLVPPQGLGVFAARLSDSYDNPLYDLEVTVRSSATKDEWTLITYPEIGVWGDGYFHENLVISDLPAGDYFVSFSYRQEKKEKMVRILPGRTTYFYFQGRLGFQDLPPENDLQYFFPIDQ